MKLEKLKQWVKEKHAAQTRKHGTPYYLHPFAVCDMLKEKGFGLEYQIVGLFHDLIEDTDVTYEEINEQRSSSNSKTINKRTRIWNGRIHIKN